jgi:hypothetical protein
MHCLGLAAVGKMIVYLTTRNNCKKFLGLNMPLESQQRIVDKNKSKCKSFYLVFNGLGENARKDVNKY